MQAYKSRRSLTNLKLVLDLFSHLAPSSSGPGLLVLIQAIAGSNPAGVTRK